MTITNYSEPTFPNSKDQFSNSLQIGTSYKNSETLTFLKDVYTYPPKFDLELSDKTEVETDSGPRAGLYNFLKNKGEFTSKIFKKQSRRQYLIEQNYHKYKKTKSIYTALKSVPIYVLLNPMGEIAYENRYFDSPVENHSDEQTKNRDERDHSESKEFKRSHKLALMFFDRDSAEMYLNEVEDRRKPVGMGGQVKFSIHCIGLDSAYCLSNNKCAEIDYRFVPSFSEINQLIHSLKKGDSRFIFDKNQYSPEVFQKTSQFKTVKPEYISSSVLKNQSFNGVPIYIIQVPNSSPNIYLRGISSIFDSIKSIAQIPFKILSLSINLQSKWILEGKLKVGYSLPKITTYICFNRDQVIQLVESFGQNTIPPINVQTNFSNVLNKPKIYISSLEDFVATWEECILNQPAENTTSSIHFIPLVEEAKRVEEYYNGPKQTLFKRSQRFLHTKCSLLVKYFSIFANSNS